MRYRIITLLVALVAAASACEKESKQSMTPASGTVSPKERAADAIAVASCDHAANCGQIGWERDYANRSACLNDARREVENLMQSCIGQPDSDELQECLDAVAEGDCLATATHVARVGDCAAPELCMHTPNMPGEPTYDGDDIYEGTDDSPD